MDENWTKELDVQGQRGPYRVSILHPRVLRYKPVSYTHLPETLR